MAQHKAYLHLETASMEVGKNDVIFRIHDRDSEELIGELRISRGAVVWRGRHDVFGRKMRWERFDDIMQKHGRRAEMRPKKRRRLS